MFLKQSMMSLAVCRGISCPGFAPEIRRDPELPKSQITVKSAWSFLRMPRKYLSES